MPRLITDRERRDRLAVRHAVHPAYRVSTALEAAQAMTVLHATDASTVHLSVAARAEQGAADVDTALYDDRSIVKQLAMRRTLFVFPRDLLPAAWGSAAARTAATTSRQLVRDLERSGVTADGEQWLAEARA